LALVVFFAAGALVVAADVVSSVSVSFTAERAWVFVPGVTFRLSPVDAPCAFRSVSDTSKTLVKSTSSAECTDEDG
jgi:hypothetical protein